MKTSAGLLIWRRRASAGDEVEVLLAHPGGPLFARKDDGVWSIPKGELDPGEDVLAAAYREFAEEIGSPAPAGEPVDLGESTQLSRKRNRIFAVEGDLDVTTIASNDFEMEWPPRSGRVQSFPEMDRAGWFGLEAAERKLFSSQRVFLDRLREALP